MQGTIIDNKEKLLTEEVDVEDEVEEVAVLLVSDVPVAVPDG